MIELSHINKSYPIGNNELPVLQDINFKMDAGELVSIVGTSGSGKSTLMNIIGLLDQPSKGKYLLNHNEVSTLDDDQRSEIRNKTIGFVFQSFFLLPKLTALQNVCLPIQYRHEHFPDVTSRALHILERVGVKQYANHKPNELSGGQQQRVAIARALIGKPTVILADEPTGALDTQTSSEVMNLFKELNRNEKTSVIIITHDPTIAEQCNRVVRIQDGLLESQ